MIIGLILAGGMGTRMNQDMPKQFMDIGNRPIVLYAIERFIQSEDIDMTMVLVPEEWLTYMKNIIDEDNDLKDRVQIIAGGRLRNDTIMNGIYELDRQGLLDDNTILITHDAARPFVTARMIHDNIIALESSLACDTVIPATDTIVVSEDKRVIKSVPDRGNLYYGQTPQSFYARPFQKIYEELDDEEKERLTDAINVFVLKGESVAMVQGEPTNIKITYPSDLILANAIREA